MQVDYRFKNHQFDYRITPDKDDTTRFRPQHSTSQQTLVRNKYSVRVPQGFNKIHNDVHAVAIWMAIHPLVKSSLQLPFSVSEKLAQHMESTYGVILTNVDPAQSPRDSVDGQRSGLLFSGGVDSLAAAIVMPKDTAALFGDRIPHYPEGQDETTRESLIDQHQARKLSRLLRRRGFNVQRTVDDHEFLSIPYPRPHSQEQAIPFLYMADTLGMSWIGSGDVLCPLVFRGHHDGGVSSWGFHVPDEQRSEMENGWEPSNNWSNRLLESSRGNYSEISLLGMRRFFPVLGLTETGTAIVVNKSPFKQRATSCKYPSGGNYCLRCDQCFRTILLDYILDHREVPNELFEHFLSFSYLADIFRRPYFDWHHEWYYIFQRIKCKHPLAIELNRQTKQGPDLSVFEKWYPKVDNLIPLAVRDEVVENIQHYVEPMKPADIENIENLHVPPLYVWEDLLPKRQSE